MKDRFYCLDMFPYPSGAGLHVGHPRGYTATDIYSRFKRMQGFEVLHPMGWDAFGLPAENYALKNKVHPADSVKENIKRFKRQLKIFNFSYDWDKEINTTDPKYYKWTQWIFLKLYKAGLAYEADTPINFCPSCKTGLANEEVIKGYCERCKTKVVRKKIRQWMLKITSYADRLLEDLEGLDWPEPIKEMQRNWIGRSEGARIKFKIQNSKFKIEVYTTRADTLFGATYMVLSPEHELISNLKPVSLSASRGGSQISNLSEVEKYIKQASQKSDLDRTDLAKAKTGVEIKGIKAINPINNKKLPIFIADYVLSTYGTGAIMAVPAHDQRDWEFAKKYKLSIIEVISPSRHSVLDTESKILNPACHASQGLAGRQVQDDVEKEAYTGEGILVNSGKFSGLKSKEAIKKITSWLEKNKLGKKAVNYKLRDWIFSRQRYWGEPIPIVHCKKCGIVAVPEKDLPVILPFVKNYEPTGTGESPLANKKDPVIKKWLNVKCPRCGRQAKRETNTMPQWAGSCWYYLAYLIKKGKKYKWNKEIINRWLPINLYVGGAEHAVLHLLYARFWHKVLYDGKYVGSKEPFQKLINVGIILGPDGQKMSKSRGNIISPDGLIKKYGADTLRIYEMFIGPFSQRVAWDTKGILGVKRFLDKVWKLFICHSERSEESLRDPSAPPQDDKKIIIKLNQTIKKVTDDIENFGFNTAVSAMMEFVNEATTTRVEPLQIRLFLLVLSPFAPHLCEELWSKLGCKGSTLAQRWPKADKKYLLEKEITIAIQVNGKLRDTIKIEVGTSEKDVIEMAKNAKNVKKYLGSNKIKEKIYIKDHLVNFVI